VPDSLAVPPPADPTPDGRSTRWDRHKAQRRADMLDAAIAEIEANGVDISVRQIADRLNLPRPAVYRHFGDRADLDEQIRGRILESLMAELMPALRLDGTLRAAVRGAIGTYIGWIERHPRLHHFLAVGSHRRKDSSPVLAGARQQIGVRLAELFAAVFSRYGADTALARPLAYAHIGLVDGFVNDWRSHGGQALTSERVVEVLTESALVLIEGNARMLDIPVDRDTVLGSLWTAQRA
jgi:AcrR family transcriptional regulator